VVISGSSQPLMHSMSLSALQPSEQEKLQAQAAAVGSTCSGDNLRTVRRVASAPALPPASELQAIVRVGSPALQMQGEDSIQQGIAPPSVVMPQHTVGSHTELNELLQKQLATAALLSRQQLGERPGPVQFPPARTNSPPLLGASGSVEMHVGAAVQRPASGEVVGRQLSSSFSGQDLLHNDPIGRVRAAHPAASGSSTSAPSGAPTASGGSVPSGTPSSASGPAAKGPPHMLSGSPRLAIARTAGSSASPPGLPGNTAYREPSLGPSSPIAALGGSTARSVVSSNSSSQPRPQSRGLRSATRMLSGGVQAPRGGQLAYSTASATMQRRPSS